MDWPKGFCILGLGLLFLSGLIYGVPVPTKSTKKSPVTESPKTQVSFLTFFLKKFFKREFSRKLKKIHFKEIIQISLQEIVKLIHYFWVKKYNFQ